MSKQTVGGGGKKLKYFFIVMGELPETNAGFGRKRTKKKKKLSKALKWKVRLLWALNETCNAAFNV